jgi:arginine/lysine/histidine transporter system substrate-binding protein
LKKIISVLLMSILLMGVLAACGTTDKGTSDNKEAKVLIMGTSAEFPPFETVDPNNGEFIGFDIDLAKAITSELGYELEIKDMKFDGLIGALQAGTIDFIASGMSATEDRKKNVDFSTEYLHANELFVTTKDSAVKGMDDIEGITVGTQLGSIQEAGAKKLAETTDMKVKTLDRVPDLVQELKAGRIDAVLLDEAVADGFIKDMDLAGFKNENSASPGMAIAFPKGKDAALVEEFNKVLKQMEENGEFKKLQEKWGISQ